MDLARDRLVMRHVGGRTRSDAVLGTNCPPNDFDLMVERLSLRKKATKRDSQRVQQLLDVGANSEA